MKKIPIGEATVHQLRHHAEVVLGIELNRVENGGQIKAKIEAASPGTTEIIVEETHESPAQADAVKRTAEVAAAEAQAKDEQKAAVAKALPEMSAKQAAQHQFDPKIEIFIPASKDAGGDRDVPVAVNGTQWTIKRNIWVEVPYRVFEALEHATEKKYDYSNDDLGRMQVTEREVYSYDFRTKNEPTEEELEEWRRRTASVELA